MSYSKGKIGKSREKAILIDVDGVCANFVGSVCEYIEKRFSLNKIDQKKIYSDVRLEAGGLWDDECENYIKQSGYAQSIKEFPGSIEAIQKIGERWPIIFVTSPYPGSKTWCHDRFEWLKLRFPDLKRDDIIFARDKRFIDGITLVDDRWENVLDWSRHWTRFGILKRTPQNLKKIKQYDPIQVGSKTYSILEEGHDKEAMFFALKNWNTILHHLEIFIEGK